MVNERKFILYFCLITIFVNSLCFQSCKREPVLSLRLEEKFVLKGDGVTPFYEPGGVTVDNNGNIYVADSGNQRIVKFNSEGKFLKSFGTKGQGPGEFLSPWQLAVYNNEIYVYDWRRNIQKFTLNGAYITGFNLRGGIFLDFVIDSEGNIYVGRWTSDKENFLIEKFDSNGNLIKRFCESIKAQTRPLTLIYNNSKLCIDNQDNIYIAFRYINKIRKYNSDGELVNEFERTLTYSPIKPEHTPNDEKPFNLDGITGDIICDENERLFVLSNKVYNENGHLIDVLGPEGKFLASFYSRFLGEELPPFSELLRDQSIFIDVNHNFYVLDFGSMNVHVFKILYK
jgi:hypothetical protein